MKQGDTVLVTGGAVRIGRAVVETLAEAGYRVVIHCRSSVAEAESLRSRLAASGREAWVVRGGLDTERGVDAVWRAAVKAAGRVDALVNSAAVFHAGRLDGLTGGRLLQEFWPNLFAPMLLTRHFAAQRLRRGAIVNLLDRRIVADDPAHMAYSLTKKGLADFTRAAALELAPRIRVNAVAPGPVLPPPGKPLSHLAGKAGRIPLRRTVAPGDVAAAVLMLLRSPSTTGQIFFVDGGQHLLGNGV